MDQPSDVLDEDDEEDDVASRPKRWRTNDESRGPQAARRWSPSSRVDTVAGGGGGVVLTGGRGVVRCRQAIKSAVLAGAKIHRVVALYMTIDAGNDDVDVDGDEEVVAGVVAAAAAAVVVVVVASDGEYAHDDERNRWNVAMA